MCIFECCSFFISSIIKSISFPIKKEHLLILFQSINLLLINIFFNKKPSENENSYFPNFITLFSYFLLSILWFIIIKHSSNEKKVLIENCYISENEKPIDEIDVNKTFLPEISIINKIKLAIILFIISFFSPFLYSFLVIYYYKSKEIKDKYLCLSFLIFLIYLKKFQKKKLFIRYWLPCLIYFIASIVISISNKEIKDFLFMLFYFIIYGLETSLFHYYMNFKYVNVSIICLFQSISLLIIEIFKYFFFPNIQTFLYFEIKIAQYKIIKLFSIILIIIYYFLNNLTIYYLEPGNILFQYLIKLLIFVIKKRISIKDLSIIIIGLICHLLFNEFIVIDFTLIFEKEKETDCSQINNLLINEKKYIDVQ